MKSSRLPISLLALAYLAAGPAAMAPLPLARPQPTASGPFEPTWDSLEQHYQLPAWFPDAKFGIFIHWGLYAIPAHHNEWYAAHMYSTLLTLDPSKDLQSLTFRALSNESVLGLLSLTLEQP